ncbi:MAG: bifunctional molybdenum cofactor biosynthesis protein MoaC/MoaB [Thermoproteota archaeon]|nr:bifunctional molybdenum cofactor biosynthesis protein MoaC/MoaB [Thermoproteota archaeon]
MSDNLSGMFDVSDKYDTSRLASAQAIIKITPSTTKLIKEGKTPKGNIFDAARVAATLAAKKAPDLIPYCHTIPIDDVKILFSFNENANSIEIKAQVKTVWKTGVEMEALTAASVASLTIYDMLKPIDESLSIESIKVIDKQGGSKNLLHYESREKYTAAVLVSSDSRGPKEDRSGKIIVNKLKKNGFKIIEYKVVADDAGLIESNLKRFCDELGVNLVLTTGGTGVGPRDNTPEATKKIIRKEVDGIEETLRCFGQRRVPSSMLSRGVAGIRDKTIIVNLPGSTGAVTQSLNAILPGLLHAFEMLEGEKH